MSLEIDLERLVLTDMVALSSIATQYTSIVGHAWQSHAEHSFDCKMSMSLRLLYHQHHHVKTCWDVNKQAI
jgi:hypothetical protein